MDDFGDFEEVTTEPSENTDVQPGFVRARLPRGKEKIGVIVQRLGGNRMEVRSTDGKTRNCRVPGRFKRKLWLRPKDTVLIEPWEDDDGKGDVIYKFSPPELTQLRKRGLLDNLNVEF